MAKSEFKCSSCNRSFSMAAHLARHKNAMHTRGGRPKGRPKGSKKVGRPRGRVGRPPLSRGSTPIGDDGTRILSEMETYRDTLLMERSTIDRRLEGIESALSAIGSFSGGSIPTRRRKPLRARRGPGRRAKGKVTTGAHRGRKPGRPGSLKLMIVKVLRQRSKPLTPQEIADSVVRAGYKTSSENLTKSVSNTLPKLSEVRKVDRGLYQA